MSKSQAAKSKAKPKKKETLSERERRRGPRWRLDLPIAYWDQEDHELNGRAADLSVSGLGFFVEVPAAVGTPTKVRFTLPASKETFELMGTVRSASGSRIGIQFAEMSDLLSAELLAAIFAELMATRPEARAITDPVELKAMEARLSRTEAALARASGAERRALEEEAEAMRALIAGNRKALGKLD